MTLEEIFKTNPKLLEEPEVQKLITYVDTEHRRTANLCKKYQDFHDAVLDEIMNSQIIIRSGKSCEHTLNDILQLLEKT